MDDMEMMEGLYKQRETNDGSVRAIDYLGKSPEERAEALCSIKDHDSGREFYLALSGAIEKIAMLYLRR